MEKYVIPKVDSENTEEVEVGRYFFSMEKARTTHKCPCGNTVKKGDLRLHVGGYNNVNSGNACTECAIKLKELIGKWIQV